MKLAITLLLLASSAQAGQWICFDTKANCQAAIDSINVAAGIHDPAKRGNTLVATQTWDVPHELTDGRWGIPNAPVVGNTMSATVLGRATEEAEEKTGGE